MKALISPEPTVLGFLLHRPLHGYELYSQVNEQLGLVWRVGQSQLYSILNGYASRGWIRASIQKQSTRPAKKMLQITPAGRIAFTDWLAQPAHGLREFRVDFFLRLYFARTTGIISPKHLLDQQIAASRIELDTLRTLNATSEDTFNRLTRSFRIQQLTTILKWLESNRAELEQQSKNPVAAARKLRAR
jgi:DNA-binding PadR family transcriptional regulator